MAIIKSFSPFQNLSNLDVQVVDTDPNSLYFRITEFQETFTGGKNGFLIEGSEFLKPSTEVKIELLDVEGNPIFYIPGDGIPEYYEGVSKLVSVHVYEDTPIGQGKITILGELERYIDENGDVREVPDTWKGFYNVKWERTFRVNKNLNNETIVRFVKRPQVQIDEIVKPFFTKEIPQITQTGSASGIGENPVEGTNLTGYTAGTLYRLAITDDSNFTSSVDENIITFPDLGYSSTVREVLNNKEVLVDVPYTINNIVTNFQNQSYTTTFEDLESQSTVESALTGSFAKIKLNRLKTFVGDVARVKVFRKSRNEVGDFQLVQDARIESTELLRDITVQDDTEVFYGNFTQNILDTYWVSGSDDHPISLDDTKLFGGIQVDYNEGIGGTQTFITSESFEIEDDVEYNLSFKTLFDGTINSSKTISAFLTSSYSSSFEGEDILVQVRQNFVSRSADPSFNNRVNISENLVSTFSGSARLGFEFVGADWYVSKVSLKNAQETSFSPDELTLIQDVPRRLPQETFDFRFEFYDVNNNFIPVSVTATKEFVGGNDFRTEQKLFTFESSQTAFRFITGSLGNPPFQQIRFSNTIQNLTGSVLYTSQAFDIDGNLITSESYHDSGVLEYPGGFSGSYPGLLQNPSNAGALLPISNFSGSVSGVTVGSIIYTASLESRQEFETIFRFEDGEDAPALIVTSNTNQFIYEPTQLRPKPLGQEVRIKAQRKNLGSLIRDIEIYASGSFGKDKLYGTGSFTTLGYPDISGSVTTIPGTGVSTYTLSAIQFSQSFAGEDGPYGDITYEFSSSDEFNNTFSDEITVSPVINFDGLSVVLSNESTAFRANSQGLVLDDFASGDGEVEVRIGENIIQHSDGLTTRNRFDIISASETNVTAIDTTPNTNEYGITALTADSGSLVLDIKYLAGDNATSQSFTKKVNYTKNRISPPAILIDTENRNQNKDANSTGEQLTVFENSDVTLRELYTGSVTTFGGGDVFFTITSGSNDKNGNPLVSVTGTTLSFGKLPDGNDSTTVRIEALLTDSEGANRTVQDTVSLSKSRKAAPSVLVSLNPQTQTIQSGSLVYQSPNPIVVSVKEGTTSYSPGSGNETFTIGSITGPFTTSTNQITTTLTEVSESISGTAVVSYTNSESSSDSEDVSFSIAVAREGDDGEDGEPGVSGVTVEVDPPSQTLTSGSTGLQATSSFQVQVTDSSGSYTYVTSSPTSGQFTIQNESNAIDTQDNGIMSPITSSIDFTGVTSTFDVVYVDRGDNEVTSSKSHRVGVVLDGSTGPGIVATGIWTGSRSYQYDLSEGRRDAVLWHDGVTTSTYDTYYATLQPSSGQQPDETSGSFWEKLGKEDFFVAAKIGIFENSFIQNTLNIGSNNNGGLATANITLFGGDDTNGGSTNPYISIDQADTIVAQGYEQDGIFLGMHNNTGSFSIVNSDEEFLKWNGTGLDVKAQTFNLVAGKLGIGNTVTTSDLDTTPIGSTTLTDQDINITTNGESSGTKYTSSTVTSTASNQTVYFEVGITNTNIIGGSGTVTIELLRNGTVIKSNSFTLQLQEEVDPFLVTGVSTAGSQTFQVRVTYDVLLRVTGTVQFVTTVDFATNLILDDPPIALNENGLFTRIANVEVPLISLIGQAGGGGTSSGGSAGVTSITGSAPIQVDATTGDVTISASGVATLGANTFTGNQTAPNFTIFSDIRLKTDLKPIETGIEIVSQLYPYEYTKNSVREIGIIAQDLEKVSPASVHENKDGYKVVDTMALSTLNLSAIKELIDQFVYLEERVKKLEDK